MLDIINDYRTNRTIAIILMLIVGFLGVCPHLPVPTVMKWQDKLEHMAAFFAISFFICRSFSKDTIYELENRISLAILICITYGAFIETVQGFIPSRDPSLTDLIADVLGAILGVIFFRLVPFFDNVKR